MKKSFKQDLCSLKFVSDDCNVEVIFQNKNLFHLSLNCFLCKEGLEWNF